MNIVELIKYRDTVVREKTLIKYGVFKVSDSHLKELNKKLSLINRLIDDRPIDLVSIDSEVVDHVVSRFQSIVKSLKFPLGFLDEHHKYVHQVILKVDVSALVLKNSDVYFFDRLGYLLKLPSIEHHNNLLTDLVNLFV